ncbi:putative membrane protein Ycf1 [Trichinella spiralis]|uniref:putative membrane protein Ycf1 n=1 Tax=Trichinella spiralis TaxID=6334 RepID=UPI0001EFE958|nr:putative membrane protein Ycf1 [Trichinella spiralis]
MRQFSTIQTGQKRDVRTHGRTPDLLPEIVRIYKFLMNLRGQGLGSGIQDIIRETTYHPISTRNAEKIIQRLKRHLEKMPKMKMEAKLSNLLSVENTVSAKEKKLLA